MSQVNAVIEFQKGFHGNLVLNKGEIGIGIEDDKAKPYDMLQGALAACLHSTFLDVLTKKKIELAYAKYVVSGEKRETIPMTLEKVVIHVTCPHHEKEDQIRKSMELAQKYCSVYATISQVANISLELEFV